MSAVTPYVMVDDAQIFREFLERAFHAEIAQLIPLETDPRRVIHAEARIGDAVVYFADSGPDGGRCLRSPADPVHVQLWATVPDADETFERAVSVGARAAREVEVAADGSRSGGFVDPFGTLWWVTSPA
ncbi:Glyoxalase-like domain [Nocardia otitidiscaviarum]|uniref:Glyoxalase-like domain n=1 Tax=Nocardia otitidiscaviarum TaxID=1823 RepID=A0A378YL78_9NOCA|nr:VOC family protein [Nocardia otitidiscaviarum]SUA77568.1 Glyoxalase-like domain [Nocardia otitidiscaviarum]